MIHSFSIALIKEVTMLNVDAESEPETNTVSFVQCAEELELEQQEQVEVKARAKKSPFAHWPQYNNEHMQDMIWLTINHPRAHALLYFLVDQMDKYNMVRCSYKVLEEVFNVSRQTISSAIKVLREHEFITVLKSGSSNVYTINDKVFWKSWFKPQRRKRAPSSLAGQRSDAP
jgi:DNA-binding transcriptional ArsR family regulator